MAYAKPRRIPLAQIVEQALAGVVAGTVPIGPAESSSVRGVATKAARGLVSASSAAERRARLVQVADQMRRRIALRAKLRAELRARKPPQPYSSPAAIRALQAGPPPSRMFPPGAFCGVCAEDCVGELYQEPIGKHEALVNVCPDCKDYKGRNPG